jgi:hypothetical protein
MRDAIRCDVAYALRGLRPQLTFDAALDPWVFETGEWKRPGWIRK